MISRNEMHESRAEHKVRVFLLKMYFKLHFKVEFASWTQLELERQYDQDHDVLEMTFYVHHWDPFRPTSKPPDSAKLSWQCFRILHAND